ncbi:MAG TPA: YqgE/AlgH family protein [Acidimicrobiales bacterium]|nr:YqgE/AlgH family protein [Acidimicrobiales bacterium]
MASPSTPVPDGARPPLPGRLLVATTRLGDPNFEGTVVLVLDHGPPGALGIVLNRPTPVPVGEILAPWQDQADLVPPGVVFRGGPVAPDVVIGVARPAGPPPAEGWRAVVGEAGTVDLAVAPEDQRCALAGARLFSGYAGWSEGQLEAELDEDAWFVLDAAEADVFSADAERLWHDVLRRQGGELSLLAGYPRHPNLN